jgi:predicted nucleic acid-binding protein
LDTNVLASGALASTGTVAQVIDLWRRVERIEQFQALLASTTTLVSSTIKVEHVASHHEDDLVLATAVTAKADYLVTGDGALQQLGAYEGVTILSPRAFLDVVELPTEREAENGTAHPADSKPMESEDA